MSDASNAIAIVGMALRFPGASTPQQFWKNLVEGRDCARTLDRDALARLGVAEDKLNSPEYVYRSYDLDDIDQFDARFFGISPREARMADPQLRIMLEVAHECIEDSAHVLRNTNTGMYLGVADHKWWLYYSLFQSPLEEQNEVAKRIYAIKDFFATQVSHKLGLAGPSISLSSACSTGLLATHEACNHLLLYDCDYALAGGCEVLQGAGYQYLEGGLSARDGYVRTFDKDASGTVFGSGAAMVLLRRLDDAIADGDKIYAVIRATAVNNDGDQKVGYMAPGVKGQMEVIRSAIERAGISARDIGYVEAHGTGTKVGDPIEIESISRVYRRYTQDRQYCGIGSVKTNVGHLSIAAGMAGLIKTALMLHHGKIPPTLHFKEANPAIDFGSSPFYVCRELADWAPGAGKRIAGISAFGVGGTNAHAIVEEAPVVRAEAGRRPGHRVFVVTGKTETSVAAARQRLAQFVRENPAVALSEIAFSLNAGRQKFDYRSALVASTAQELIQACEQADAPVSAVSADSMRRAVFMFPGQGSQYPNMALQLYQEEPYFREQIDACLEQAADLTEIDLATILFPTGKDASTTGDLIHRTEYTQLCLFIVCYCLAQLWMRWGIRPQAMIGHSIGEYVAACLAGVFSLRDALILVANRGRLMQAMPPGSMLSIPQPKDAVRAYLDDSVCVAGENSPASCVVAGSHEAIGKLKDRLQEAGVKSTVLRTSHAFHSYMMQPAVDAYEAIVRQVRLHPPEIPLISNVTGTWLTVEQATSARYWAQQLREPVLFSKGLQTLYTPESVLIEAGPGTTLCSLLGQHDFESECVSINTLPRAKEDTGASDALAAAVGKACCVGLHVDLSVRAQELLDR
jgi:acyl transferase domain-containing protein